MNLVHLANQKISEFKPARLVASTEGYQLATVSLERQRGTIEYLMNAGAILPDLDPRDPTTVNRVKEFLEWVKSKGSWDDGIGIPFQEVYQLAGRPDSPHPIDKAIRACLIACERTDENKTRYLIRKAHVWGLAIVLLQHEAYLAIRSLALQELAENKMLVEEKIDQAFEPRRAIDDFFVARPLSIG